MAEHTLTELMVVAASKELPDGVAVLVGTGMPVAAACLARRTHAPGLLLCFEAGGVGPRSLPRLPLTVGEGITAQDAEGAVSMAEMMSMAARGYIAYGFLGGAQIDPYGNLNSTVIGAHHAPKTRFPGSGGANDIGSLCRRTLIIMKHEPRRFIPEIDFVTTPGYLSGPGAREAAGLPPDSGPYRVISTMGVMGFDDETKRMKLIKTFPGITPEAVQAATGFDLLLADFIEPVHPPTHEELRILREVVDPMGTLEMK